MEKSSSHGVTLLLRRWSEGDKAALNELTPLVYHELHSLAKAYLRRERPDHTLPTTALIHEAYLRLVDQNQKFESRKHFLGVAAHLMRMILVDHARAQGAAKRGGGKEKLSLDGITLLSPERGVDLLALHEALDRLAAFDERKSRAIELRYFGGMSVEETAEALKISVRTLQRELRFAESWLYREMTQA
jgi:RNA polymerase sigma factor (TIGR02999 family)